MFAFLATDPGAWNIILWMLVLVAIGALVLWVATTLMLRDSSTDGPEERRPQSA